MLTDPTGMNHHDYEVNKQVDIGLIRKTKDNFDTLYNQDGTQVLE